MSKRTIETTFPVIVEREMPYPPEKVWCALTHPHLLEKWWGGTNDVKPVVGHRFRLGWYGGLDCEILAVEPNKTLSYTMNDLRYDEAVFQMQTLVTFTLTPTSRSRLVGWGRKTTGTQLRMEHSGFRPDQERFYGGFKGGWQQRLAELKRVLARID